MKPRTQRAGEMASQVREVAHELAAALATAEGAGQGVARIPVGCLRTTIWLLTCFASAVAWLPQDWEVSVEGIHPRAIRAAEMARTMICVVPDQAPRKRGRS
jgi:hypothetical protein